MGFKKVLCSAVLSVTIIVSNMTVQAHVLDGAKEYNGHYYKVMEVSMDWKNASEFCKSMGGHLATGETREENEMLKQLFLGNGGGLYCWIGGIRDDKRVWRWVTGKVIADYFDWTDGGPRSDAAAGGAALCLRRDAEGKWDNFWSSDNNSFICEWESGEDAHDSTL